MRCNCSVEIGIIKYISFICVQQLNEFITIVTSKAIDSSAFELASNAKIKKKNLRESRGKDEIDYVEWISSTST